MNVALTVLPLHIINNFDQFQFEALCFGCKHCMHANSPWIFTSSMQNPIRNPYTDRIAVAKVEILNFETFIWPFLFYFFHYSLFLSCFVSLIQFCMSYCCVRIHVDMCEIRGLWSLVHSSHRMSGMKNREIVEQNCTETVFPLFDVSATIGGAGVDQVHVCVWIFHTHVTFTATIITHVAVLVDCLALE